MNGIMLSNEYLVEKSKQRKSDNYVQALSTFIEKNSDYVFSTNEDRICSFVDNLPIFFRLLSSDIAELGYPIEILVVRYSELVTTLTTKKKKDDIPDYIFVHSEQVEIDKHKLVFTHPFWVGSDKSNSWDLLGVVSMSTEHGGSGVYDYHYHSKLNNFEIIEPGSGPENNGKGTLISNNRHFWSRNDSTQNLNVKAYLIKRKRE